MANGETRPRVVTHDACSSELDRLQIDAPQERAAIRQAIAVLDAHDGEVGHPWSSAVRGTHVRGLRELRPRAGRSRWRLIYRRHEAVVVLLALAPEARTDPRGFDRAVTCATRRFDELRDGRTEHGN